MDKQAYTDLLSACREWESHKYSPILRDLSRKAMKQTVTDHMPAEMTEFFYDMYYKSLLFDAPVDFDSYLLYVEKNREPEKKFYVPRRKVILPLVHDLQDLSDGKLDFLGVSMPPRTGKLVSDDTDVLTRDGWKKHGELKAGDYVISPNGEFVKVLHVFSKSVANVRVHFTDGSYADVHENHEWVVCCSFKQIVSTRFNTYKADMT